MNFAVITTVLLPNDNFTIIFDSLPFNTFTNGQFYYRKCYKIETTLNTYVMAVLEIWQRLN